MLINFIEINYLIINYLTTVPLLHIDPETLYLYCTSVHAYPFSMFCN